MWRELVGTWGYLSGVSGSVALPAGAIIVAIRATSTAGGSITIFGGASIPIIANGRFEREFNHSLAQAQGTAGALAIVFTTTDSYYVEYVKSGNT